VPLTKLTETQAEIIIGSLKGAIRGGAMGAAGSILTGAAVVVSTPAWVPWIGGTMLISGATMATWAMTGAAIGAVTGGAWGFVRARRLEGRFTRTFIQQKGCYAQ
jgi:hypothetical protein